MALTAVIKERLDRSFGLFEDLIASTAASALNSKLPQLRSNTIGLQLWCVVGARESYSRAIQASQWSGFSCSLDSTEDKDQVAESLHRSANTVREALRAMETFSDVQYRLVVDLVEHEAAHQGQLIRYLYGLNHTIPESWRARYALD